MSCLDGVDALLSGIDTDRIITDKAFDADERMIQPLQQAGKHLVIPPKFNRTAKREYDEDAVQQGVAPNRELFRQTQTIPLDCDTLRQTRCQFPRRDLSRGLTHMAQLITSPS